MARRKLIKNVVLGTIVIILTAGYIADTQSMKRQIKSAVQDRIGQFDKLKCEYFKYRYTPITEWECFCMLSASPIDCAKFDAPQLLIRQTDSSIFRYSTPLWRSCRKIQNELRKIESSGSIVGVIDEEIDKAEYFLLDTLTMKVYYIGYDFE